MVSVSCFGVRVSVMSHLKFVHYSFSSVWVAERDLPFDCSSSCSLLFYYFDLLADYVIWEV